ncbi:MAG: hypothetical protein AAB529_02960 [Patescibacteria group bacterium]
MIIGHQKQWDFLRKKFELEKLSHAYLFVGEGQLGKKRLAKEFVKFINCQDRKNVPRPRQDFGGQACQKCFSCQAIDKGSFPDLKIITKKEDKNEIEILQIRETLNFLSYKSYYGFFKAVIIDGAEEMNQEAQSCFLKTLEEPKGKTILFLITSKPDMLLPTISSRCQTLKFFRSKNFQPDPEKLAKEQTILSELLKVINSDFSEKFKYVKSIDFEKQKVKDILEPLLKYFRQLLLAKIGAGNSPAGKEADNYPVLKIKQVINLIENINTQTSLTNASPKLALEILLMEV